MAWGDPWEQKASLVAKDTLSITDVKQADQFLRQGERFNKVPTHDPYTNPNSQIYYSCECGAILDPGTRRFAELNNAASAAGWKIRWGENHYIPYCKSCAEGIE